jgi:hypothetical protein
MLTELFVAIKPTYYIKVKQSHYRPGMAQRVSRN